MKRRPALIACGILLAASASPALACLNDTEVRRTEDEFRSRYQQPRDQPPSWRSRWGVDLPGAAGLMAGVGIISLVCARTARRPR